MSPLRTAGCLAGALVPVAGRAAETMPQLDIANPLTAAHVVWGAIIFFALYLLLARWALPQVATVLEQRTQRIAADLEAARGAKAEADAAVRALTETTHRARAESQAAINSAVDRAKAAAAEQAREAGERVEAQLRAAEARIGAARSAAMSALREVTSETTRTMVARLTGITPEPAAVDAAVGRALEGRALV